jgi:hypothetical protein
MRERVVLISKGAHPNDDRVRVTPEDITSDLRDTLAGLGGPSTSICCIATTRRSRSGR